MHMASGFQEEAEACRSGRTGDSLYTVVGNHRLSGVQTLFTVWLLYRHHKPHQLIGSPGCTLVEPNFSLSLGPYEERVDLP